VKLTSLVRVEEKEWAKFVATECEVFEPTGSPGYGFCGQVCHSP